MSISFRVKPASVLILLSTAASASAVAPPTTIALSGAAAPGTGAGTFTNFTNPVLNASGQVAFQASVAGGTSTSGIYTGTSASVSPVALQGTVAPGTGGGTYGSLYTSNTSTSVTLNSNGTLAFTATGITGGTSSAGIFTGSSAANLQAAALQGTAAPAGGNFNVFLSNGTNQAYSPVLNSYGTLGIQSTLSGGSSAAGIFVGTPGSLTTAALVGGAAPTPPGGIYATTVTVPTINASGQVSFVSIVGGEEGIFAGAPGAIQTAMYQGYSAPGTSAVLNSSGGTGLLYGTPTTTYSYNNAGQVGFITMLTGGATGQPSAGVFAGAPGAVQNLALGYNSSLQTSTNGSVAPGGTGATFGTFSNVTVNGLGQAAFSGVLVGGTYGMAGGSGLFLGSTSSNLQAIALSGGTAPDGETYTSFGGLLTNDNGDVAFLASVTGGGTQELVAGTPGNLTELVKDGDTVDGMTVNGFGLLLGSGGQDGKGIDFNDSDEVVYRLTFTNGASGIFESAAPEPTTIAFAAIGAIPFLARRSRRA